MGDKAFVELSIAAAAHSSKCRTPVPESVAIRSGPKGKLRPRTKTIWQQKESESDPKRPAMIKPGLDPETFSVLD